MAGPEALPRSVTSYNPTEAGKVIVPASIPRRPANRSCPGFGGAVQAFGGGFGDAGNPTRQEGRREEKGAGPTTAERDEPASRGAPGVSLWCGRTKPLAVPALDRMLPCSVIGWPEIDRMRCQAGRFAILLGLLPMVGACTTGSGRSTDVLNDRMTARLAPDSAAGRVTKLGPMCVANSLNRSAALQRRPMRRRRGARRTPLSDRRGAPPAPGARRPRVRD